VIVPELPGPALAAMAQAVLPEKASRLLIVSDTNVAPLYLEHVARGLSGAAYGVVSHVLPAGEEHKDLAAVASVVDAALAHRLTRHDAIVALGGGVVGDIAGFAAAITMRGLAFLQVPTTLLAQVDSAVGGKTGVNHKRGKNLIGAFWQPRAVVSSQATLATLPDREVRGGLAEAVKHGFIADPELLGWARENHLKLAALDEQALAHLVASCCRIKAAVVAEDEREDLDNGRRVILNFGHTFGHAFENVLGYGAITHGEAVALGMVYAARLSDRIFGGRLEPEVVALLGLPNDPFGPQQPSLGTLMDAARGDKKADAVSGVRFVLLEALGKPVVRSLSWGDIAERLR